MPDEESSSRDGEDIWLSEEIVNFLFAETWLRELPLLSEDLRSSRLEHVIAELLHNSSQHHHVLGLARSIVNIDSDTQSLEPISQILSNGPRLYIFNSEPEANFNISDLRRESRFDTNLDVSSNFEILRSPTEIHELFPSLNIASRNPMALSDQRQTFTEVRPSSDLVEDLDVTNFLERWGRGLLRRTYSTASINLEAIRAMRRSTRPLKVNAEAVSNGRYDFQGINWHALGTTRNRAQRTRKRWYKETFCRSSSSTLRSLPLATSTPSFHFHAYTSEPNPYIQHYQLRNLITAPTRNSVFIASNTETSGLLGSTLAHSEIGCYSPTFSTITTALSFPPKHSCPAPSAISCLTSSHDILAAGGVEGEYAYKSLYSADDGTFTSNILCPYRSFITSRLTNHIHVSPARRSGVPQLICASNDKTVRTVDTATNTITAKHTLPWSVNCSVTSPDHRLRLVVGDHNTSRVLDAETGRILVELSGARHHADGFACDWDEGVYVATGHADGLVSIWDARRWEKPIAVFGTEVESARGLKFSEPGAAGGKRLLVAEAADVVSVVDARDGMFDKREVVGVFGEIAGVDWVGGGEDGFVVGIADRRFGGVLEFKPGTKGRTWEEWDVHCW